MTDRELMQQALEALTTYDGTNGESKRKRVLDALRERLAQPWEKFCDTHCTAFDHHPNCKLAQQQEPVAWMIDWPDEPELGHYFAEAPSEAGRSRPLYTSTPASKPLTNDRVWLEYMQLWPFRPNEEPTLAKDILRFARAIEQAHGIGKKPDAA